MEELESFSILDILDSVISRVAQVVVATEKSGIRVDWLDESLVRFAHKGTILFRHNKKSNYRLGLSSFAKC